MKLVDIPKIELREFREQSFLVWVLPDGEEAGILDLDCIQDPKRLIELQVLAKDGKLDEEGAWDLVAHYAIQEIFDQRVPHTVDWNKDFVFEAGYWGMAALAAANKGLFAAKSEIKAGLKEPDWVPLALEAGWTPPK